MNTLYRFEKLILMMTVMQMVPTSQYSLLLLEPQIVIGGLPSVYVILMAITM
jgi:hypothetical protein